jgi:predicted nucleic acid-binding protein
MPGTVLLDTNVFTAWLKPRSTLVPLYGKHVFGRRIAIAQQTVAEARYGAVVADWGDKRLDNLERLIIAARFFRRTRRRRGHMRGCAPNVVGAGIRFTRSSTGETCGSPRRPSGGSYLWSHTMLCTWGAPV